MFFCFCTCKLALVASFLNLKFSRIFSVKGDNKSGHSNIFKTTVQQAITLTSLLQGICPSLHLPALSNHKCIFKIFVSSVNLDVHVVWHKNENKCKISLHLPVKMNSRGNIVACNYLSTNMTKTCSADPGVSIKAGYRWSTAACRTSCRCLMKINMKLLKLMLQKQHVFLMPRMLKITFPSF